MPAPVTVSVIIPTRNRSSYLRQALDSVRALEGPDIELEVIVVDNGSTDDTREVVHDLKAHYVYAHPSRCTPGAVRNAGMKQATGEFIAFLDDDDVWLPSNLRPHLQLLAERSDFAAVIGQFVTTNEALEETGVPWPENLPVDGNVFRSLLATDPQIGTVVVRRSVLDTVGYQNEEKAGGEDWDWFLRIALKHRVGFVNVPCILFRQHAPGQRDERQWQYFADTNATFREILQVAGNQRPNRLAAWRLSYRRNGLFARQFLQNAAAHAAAGKHREARNALWRAFRLSPVHTLKAMRNATVSRAFLCSLYGRSASRTNAA